VVSAEKFFVSPQNESSRETALLPNEILTEIQVPPARGVKNATYEIRQKEALDWPLVTASVALHIQGSTVQKALVVLGHVAPTPWPAAKASQLLQGQALTAENIAQAAEAAGDGAQPLSGNDYKVKLVRVAVKRALLEASGKA
jgi:xanthine dehydrogenase YagS FAD-binding subunit